MIFWAKAREAGEKLSIPEFPDKIGMKAKARGNIEGVTLKLLVQ